MSETMIERTIHVDMYLSPQEARSLLLLMRENLPESPSFDDLVHSVMNRLNDLERFAGGGYIRSEEVEEGDEWVIHDGAKGVFTSGTCTHGCCLQVLMDDGSHIYLSNEFLPTKEDDGWDRGHIVKKGATS